jgi:2-hydroxy-6-oxonona-2,4-dienedioate hydrolase
MMAPMSGSMAATELDVTYRPAADPTPPVVLLPGLVGADWIWTRTVADLTAAGHGTLVWNTPIALLDADLASSIPALRRSVLALLDHLSIERAVLCGSSLGALLALDVGSAHPDRTASLIVSGAPGLHETVLDVDYLLQHTDREVLQEYGKRLFYSEPDALDPQLVEQTIDMVLHRPTALKILRAFQAARAHDTVGILPGIASPVRMIWGENDLITPLADWRPHLHRIPRVELHVLPACGHAPMVERPDEWSRLVLEFVSRTADRPA